MRIIDAHVHFSNIQALRQGAQEAGVEYTARGFSEECFDNGVIGCVCMGLSETAPGLTPDKLAITPMGADLAPPPLPMGICLGINPHTLDSSAVAEIKNMIALQNDIVGFKIYAGYYHVDVNDAAYEPVFKLACEYGLPVAIHGGDTYFKGGLLEYSHPLRFDRLAYTYPDLKIVICHMGFPWIMDACIIAAKNDNVYVDISGLSEGDAAECDSLRTQPLYRDYYKQGLMFLDDYKKVIFGTDWPLTPIGPYIELCKELVPQTTWEDVFYNNAVGVYGNGMFQ